MNFERNYVWIGLGIVSILLILATILLQENQKTTTQRAITPPAPTSTPTPTFSRLQVSASLGFANDLEITSAESSVVSECVITVPANGLKPDFSSKIEPLRPGEKRVVYLSGFSNSQGEVLENESVSKVIMTCKDSGGKEKSTGWSF